MTNKEIILSQSLKLMEAGVLKGSGIKEEVTINGNLTEIELPEEIHTYAVWKRLGYQVKKGEHAITKFAVWVAKKSKTKQEDGKEDKETTKMYLKTASFFSLSQVKSIEETA